MSNRKELFDTQTIVEEAVKEQIEEPAKYHVFLLNDDYTPMDFVVDVLCNFFNKTAEQATDIMLTIHNQGKGLCGIYTAEIAETKVEHVVQYAFEHQHPLKCVMKKA
ncbi:ATP-dependent Clp protease adapter ClpS [Colwellia sp. TT2012]|uniref:ATP-dependent Clp protease adapter ClpS n=1 Tax=Colwellia sp. TT2012 TaxID=1720342 RepID=UPI00070CEC10|nr:ATP-dependent Clp protease adapter ClpS [Colwellia sp. TT2012]